MKTLSRADTASSPIEVAPAPSVRRRIVAAVVWLVAVLVVGWSVVRGRDLQQLVPDVNLGAAPLIGRDRSDGWQWRWSPTLIGAVVVAASVGLVWWRGWYRVWRLRIVTAFVALAAMGFAVLLALVDGADGILHGATDRTEYLANLPSTPPTAAFLRTFLERLDSYSVHVRGHPPGFVVLLRALAAIGLPGRWPAALLSVAACGVLVVAVVSTVATVAGADLARRAAPFLVVAPYTIWMYTSADAVYTAVGALGIAAVSIGTTHARRAPAAAWGVVGGLLLGAAAFGTYLAAWLVPVALVIVAKRRRDRRTRPGAVVAGAALGGLAVVLTFLGFGFWWISGAVRTTREYWSGTANVRPWNYFLVANIAVALIALGPATLAGVVRLRDRRLWLLVGSALAVLVLSDLSQYTKAEVERIWLLFYPWIAVAAAALVRPTHDERRSDVRAATWIGVQAACAIGLQAALVSKW